MWEKGLRGKAWRVLKNLNTDLTATIKTRYSLTREVDMEVGGKQGLRLTGRMFCIMMHRISEELSKAELGFTLSRSIDRDFVIAVLLWVDDVMTCVDRVEDQKEILLKLDEFATKHKLQWSKEKCNIMRVGKHKKETVDWKLGGDSLKETTKYKYLGDIITADGKNDENIQARKAKTYDTTVTLNTIATSDIHHRIETAVLLIFHEGKIISSLLTNA